jgi:hypothetical protein
MSGVPIKIVAGIDDERLEKKVGSDGALDAVAEESTSAKVEGGHSHAHQTLSPLAIALCVKSRVDALDPYCSPPLQHKPPVSGAALPER